MNLPTDEEDVPLLVGDEFDPDRVELWVEFLYGCWEQGLPDLPGTYPVATLEGDFVGFREYSIRDGEIYDPRQGHAEPGWLGFRWSIAVPPPPKGI